MREFWTKAKKNPAFILSMTALILWVLFAAFGEFFLKYDPYKEDFTNMLAAHLAAVRLRHGHHRAIPFFQGGGRRQVFAAGGVFDGVFHRGHRHGLRAAGRVPGRLGGYAHYAPVRCAALPAHHGVRHRGGGRDRSGTRTPYSDPFAALGVDQVRTPDAAICSSRSRPASTSPRRSWAARTIFVSLRAISCPTSCPRSWCCARWTSARCS